MESYKPPHKSHTYKEKLAVEYINDAPVHICRLGQSLRCRNGFQETHIDMYLTRGKDYVI